MIQWFKSLDQILRGEATKRESLKEGKIQIPLKGIILATIFLAAFHGLCIGVFALFREDGAVPMQMIASAVKVPALFYLTLLITFPSLYVFNALVGSRLYLKDVLHLLVASFGVTISMLSALGLIVAFFSLSTTNYPFMVLFNVFVFAVAGLLGMKFVLQTLHRMNVMQEKKALNLELNTELNADLEEILKEGPKETEGPLENLDSHLLRGHVKAVFQCWVIVFGLVGGQMGWILRPFIGNPDQPFTWFRERNSNFFEAVFHTFRNLIGL